MRIKLGPNVLDMRGKLGQWVYGIWKAGVSVARQAAEVVRNPSSPAQQAVRSAQREFTTQWKALPEADLAAWQIVADLGVTRKNPEGGVRALIGMPKGKMSGFNAFLEANQLARSVGATTPIGMPALGTAAPNAPVDLAASFDGDKITVTWGDIEGVMPSQFVRVWVYSEQGLFHKQLVDFAPGAAKTMNITTIRAKYGVAQVPALFLNTAVLIQADTVDQATGWASNPTLTKRLYLVEPAP